MNKDLIICLLDADRHDRDAFDCGEPALNEYLQKTARQHLQKGIANTYVLVSRAEPQRILGFFTLSFLEVDLTEIPEGYGKKLPQSHLPAAKLGRLAIDKSCQGNNYGRLLLVDAMLRVADAIRNAAGVVGLFVDAKNSSVAAFYRKFGFIPLDDNPLSLMLPHLTILGLFERPRQE
jgi:GNAT superfamily N-acetyltransferase